MLYNHPVLLNKGHDIIVVCRSHFPNTYKSSQTISLIYNSQKQTLKGQFPFVFPCTLANLVYYTKFDKTALEKVTSPEFAALIPDGEPIEKQEDALVFSDCIFCHTSEKAEFLQFSLHRLYIGTKHPEAIESMDDLRSKCFLSPGESYSRLFRQRASIFVKNLTMIMI